MKYFLIISLFFVFLPSCKKEINELPPATQTGAHTFGVKIDGKYWIPQGFGPFPANDILEGNIAGTSAEIRASNFSSSPTETEFIIRLRNITGPGTYSFNTTVAHPSNAFSYIYYVKRRLSPLEEYMTSATSTGTVNITRMDTINRIVSGTFEATLTSGTGATKTLSEGRFDVQF